MELPQLAGLPGGWMTALGSMLGIIAAASIYFRNYLSGAAASRASDGGQVAAIGVYQAMVAELNLRVAEERLRADGFAKERNEAVQLLGKFEGRLESMARQITDQSQRIADQSQRIADQTQEITGLHDQIRELKEQVHANT